MKKKTDVIFKCVLTVLAAAYALAVIRIVFLREGVTPEAALYRLIPFNGLYKYFNGVRSARSLFVNYAGNVALFFPAGILLPALFKKLNVIKTAAIGCALSVLIEAVQFITKCGYADTDDVIMNTLGTALGAIIYLYVFGGRKRTLFSQTAAAFSVALILFVCVACAWYIAPGILPERMIVINQRIAGERLDEYDVRFKCRHISHGEVFVGERAAQDKDKNPIDISVGSYYIADTAIFVTEKDVGGEKKYHIANAQELIDVISEKGEVFVKLWLIEDGKCRIVMVEE